MILYHFILYFLILSSIKKQSSTGKNAKQTKLKYFVFKSDFYDTCSIPIYTNILYRFKYFLKRIQTVCSIQKITFVITIRIGNSNQTLPN